MEFLGVGPTELLFIVALAIIVLGPKDIAKTGKTVGKWLNSVIHSDAWKLIQKTSKELRHLPTQLMLDDNYEKAMMEEKQRPPAQTNAGTWAGHTGTEPTPPQTDPSIDSKNENMIHPPITVDGPPASALNPATKKTAVTTRAKSPTAKKTEKKSAKKPVTPTRTPRKKPNA
jgi:Sec-independent protein translocase protein TatA